MFHLIKSFESTNLTLTMTIKTKKKQSTPFVSNPSSPIYKLCLNFINIFKRHINALKIFSNYNFKFNCFKLSFNIF